MDQNRKSASFEKLRLLCAEEGFLDAYLMLVMRHTVIQSNVEDSDSYKKSLETFKTVEKLNEPELLLLLHLLCENALDAQVRIADEKAEELADRAEQILNEIHEEYGQQMMQSMAEMIQPVLRGEQQKQEFLKPVDLEEISLYPEEVAYSFQYPIFAKMRYKKDNKWMRDNLGFTIEEMEEVVSCITASIPLSITMCANSDVYLLNAFDISDATKLLSYGSSLDIETINRVVDFFTCDPLPLPTIKQFASFNCLSAKPIVLIGKKKYLFLPNALRKALYESPFYTMLNDSAYKAQAASHRGDFTETFVYERFVSLLGEENVYRNVNLWNGKNRSSEIDVMGMVADRAIIVQCKSKRMTQKAQQGDQLAAREDFKKAVGDAYEQNLQCALDLCNPSITVKNEEGSKLNIQRDFNLIYPICVVSDQYPSLAIQSQEYLDSNVECSPSPDNTTDQIITDVFFIDILIEMLQSPLLLIDYIDKRCLYGKQMLAQSEINALGLYLADEFGQFENCDHIVVDGDNSLDIDAAMTARRSLPFLKQQTVPPGILTRIAGCKGAFNVLLEKFSYPSDSVELAFGRELLIFQDALIDQVNGMVDTVREQCEKTGDVHSVSFSYGEDYGMSFLLQGRSATIRRGIMMANAIAQNDRQRGGNWFVLLLNAEDLSVLKLEHIVA
ncbi:hypothetical protein [Bombiscardovia coagulans]|uniref:Prepilin peptidase n=1 Tax=Bombiscardovia coagulans TaxID=686666 RepID=A0A261EVI2_9BIFI|nr:hypothetical protein [Bombiscardovia coagulans]OZG50868.1 prepilin peptidase [Bombiscardovia coagulans]